MSKLIENFKVCLPNMLKCVLFKRYLLGSDGFWTTRYINWIWVVVVGGRGTAAAARFVGEYWIIFRIVFNLLWAKYILKIINKQCFNNYLSFIWQPFAGHWATGRWLRYCLCNRWHGWRAAGSRKTFWTHLWLYVLTNTPKSSYVT